MRRGLALLLAAALLRQHRHLQPKSGELPPLALRQEAAAFCLKR